MTNKMKTVKKLTILKFILFTLIFFQGVISHSQILKNFDIRYNNKNIRGDILLIGNNILNRDSRLTLWDDTLGKEVVLGDGPNEPYNGKSGNAKFYMEYIDIDEDPNTFNSSSATLTLPDASCSKIVYAGLYWSAVKNGAEPIDKVKFKMPRRNYIDIEGTVIYNAKNNAISGVYPYACYANVTDYFTRLSGLSLNGDYTVADISTAQGDNDATGLSAGWSLFFIYENATLSEKAITTFDGFTAIDKNHNLDIKISGFTTIPVGPVRAKFAFSAIEGDLDIGGDFLAINGVKATPPERPLQWFAGKEKDNFFNSSVTSMGSVFRDRFPDSSNTLGFDAGIFEVKNNPNVANPGGTVIKNGDTSAIISLGSDQDAYFYYFNAFAVEIVAPRIVLVKEVKVVDANGNDYDVSGKIVERDKEVKYEIKFQNKGNDDATDFTITDILPENVVFDETKDILSLPTGVTLSSYDTVTRTMVFKIDQNLVKKNGVAHTIKFRVKTIKDCESLTDACSSVVENTAISKYTGTINKTILGNGSLSADKGCSNLDNPTPTTFFIGLDKCKFEQTLFLCGGGSVKLKAGSGYIIYMWKDPDGLVFGGNHQEVTVTKAGIYTVSATSSCSRITQSFYVKDYVANINDNPVNEYADNINPSSGLPYICINDGKPFPKIFLCGRNATRVIDTRITGATSIVWQEKTDVQPADLNDNCPNVSATNWTDIAYGSVYTANKAGVFRLIISYNDTSIANTNSVSCIYTYYFNVTKNLTEATFTKQDVVCDTKGSITITNPKPTDGYEYSLDGIQLYQDSNIFNNLAAGTYPVHVRPKMIDTRFEKCEYIVEVTISKLTFSTTIETTDPICVIKTGSIKITATGANEWCKFIITDSTTSSEKANSGQINSPTNYHLFTDISPGTYDVEITTKEGCREVKRVTIHDYTLSATAIVTRAIACDNGIITVTVSGGKPVSGVAPSYHYYVNGSIFPLISPIIPIVTSGDYNIIVVNDKGCSVTIPTITVPKIEKPTVKNVSCYGDKGGVIVTSVTNYDRINGFEMRIDSGLWQSFNQKEISWIDLDKGNHNIEIRYDVNRRCSFIIPASIVESVYTAKVSTDCVDNKTANLVTITNDNGNTNSDDIDYALDGTIYQQSNIFRNVASGTHTVTARHTNGCEQKTLPFIMDAVQPLTLTLADGGLNEIVAVAKGGGGNYQYTLDDKNYDSTDRFIIYKSGTYTVTVTDKNGCTATASRYSEYINVCVPNDFTPNGDGINDTWGPECAVNYKDLTFDIFDRDGRVIGKYKSGEKWDGKYNGVELASGDYWYVLKLNDKNDDREFVGHFTLYR